MPATRSIVSYLTKRAPQPVMDFVYRHRFHPLVRPFRNLALRGLGATSDGVEIVRGPLAGMILAFEDVPAEWSGIHEPEVQSFLLSEIKPGDIVYDIGAHVGYFVLLAARALGGEGRIVAYEPEARSFELMSQTVAANGLEELVIRRPVGLGDVPGRGSIGYGDSSSYAQIHMSDGGEVEVRTLDEEIESGLPEPSLLVLDTEGFEERILNGAERLLTRSQPRILAEHHQRHDELVEYLASYGYSHHDIDSGHVFFSVPD